MTPKPLEGKLRSITMQSRLIMLMLVKTSRNRTLIALFNALTKKEHRGIGFGTESLCNIALLDHVLLEKGY
jgi:hypothetical protein